MIYNLISNNAKKSRKKIALNICIYKKKPYLCIAFER
nr:MAG TPA: hypothetical protein [Caudoviricetes sp.]